MSASPNAWASASTSRHRHAALRHDPAPVRVDPDRVHRRQVEHEAAVAGREAGDAVPAAAYGEGQALAAGELHAAENVGHAAAANDQRRPLVVGAVPDRPRLVVRRVARPDQLATKCLGEFAQRGLPERVVTRVRRCHVLLRCRDQ